jgi:hypothetical protein
VDDDEVVLLLDVIDHWSHVHGTLPTSPCVDPFSDSECALDDMPLREMV